MQYCTYKKNFNWCKWFK